MISFLHMADVHLGMRATRFEQGIMSKVREARFQAVENALKAAGSKQVDFVLIAGDLFDDVAVDRTTAQRAYDLLAASGCPVFIIPGNHDPLLPGSVWERSPWKENGSGKVRLLKSREPVALSGLGVQLLPCPVFRKTSLEDPTAWIAAHSREDSLVRIGLAHGSLRVREDLPLDDHCIAKDAADRLGLDYLALGHWHKRRMYPDAKGLNRTAYAGVPEPMGFPDSQEADLGWSPYASGSHAEEFLDDGKAQALHVSIEGPGAAPKIEPLETGHLIWEAEKRSVSLEGDLNRAIQEIASRPEVGRRLLRLALEGVLSLAAMERLEELRQVLDRYLFNELDEVKLLLEPSEEDLGEVAGQGVLALVQEGLNRDLASDEEPLRNQAKRSLLLLYQIAREART